MKAYAWLATIGVFAACGGRPPVQIDPNARPVTPRWNATLQTPASLAGAVQVQGTGWMAASDHDSTHTEAHVDIANAAPGGQHPWHVHRGRCGNDLGIVGDPKAYPILDVGSDGKAAGIARLDLPAPKSGDYFVNVHASANNMGTIIACGNLAPPAR